MTRTLIMGAVLLLVGCASTPSSYDGGVKQVNSQPKVDNSLKTQQGYKVKLEKIHQVTRYGSRSEITFNPYMTKNGSLYVTIYRTTIETANLDSFSYVLKKDNKVLSRWVGRWEQPEIPDRSGLWWNIITVDTKGPLRPGVYTLKIKDHVEAVDVRSYPYDDYKITVTK